MFGRQARIIVGPKLLVAGDASAGLRVVFNIQKTLKPEPNKAELKVWNFAPITRLALEQLGAAKIPIPVQIEAGYLPIPSQLYMGNLREIISTTEGADIVTTMTTGDGEKAYQKARINQTFTKGTPLSAAMITFVAAFGAVLEGPVLPGNLLQQAYLFDTGTPILANGAVVSGNAAYELTRLLASMGKEWSIQNGQLQVLDRDKALLAAAVLLSEDTGMIGSPAVNSKGELKAQMLLAPDVFPGRLMVVKAKNVTGNYRIEACTYIGDTHGGDWTIDIEAKRLGSPA